MPHIITTFPFHVPTAKTACEKFFCTTKNSSHAGLFKILHSWSIKHRFRLMESLFMTVPHCPACRYNTKSACSLRRKGSWLQTLSIVVNRFIKADHGSLHFPENLPPQLCRDKSQRERALFSSQNLFIRNNNGDKCSISLFRCQSLFYKGRPYSSLLKGKA